VNGEEKKETRDKVTVFSYQRTVFSEQSSVGSE